MKFAVFCALLMAGLAWSSNLWADDEATKLYDEGVALLQANKVPEACAKLDQSLARKATAKTLLALAGCHETQGKTATAWDEYQRAAGLAHTEGARGLEDTAKQRAVAIKPKLSRLKLELAPGAQNDGLLVTLAGDPIDLATLGVALALDPGRYEVRASAPGFQEWATSADVTTPGQTVTVTIPKFEKVSAAPTVPPPAPMPVAPPAPPAWSPPPQQPPEQEADGPLWPMVITGFSVAGAAVIAGAVTGGIALGKGGDVKDTCNGNVCPASQQDAHDDATMLANVSNAMFAVAGVGAVVGVIGFFVPSGDGDLEVGFSGRELSLRGSF